MSADVEVVTLTDAERMEIIIAQNTRILEIMEAVSAALAQVQSHPMLGQFIGTPAR